MAFNLNSETDVIGKAILRSMSIPSTGTSENTVLKLMTLKIGEHLIILFSTFFIVLIKIFTLFSHFARGLTHSLDNSKIQMTVAEFQITISVKSIPGRENVKNHHSKH